MPAPSPVVLHPDLQQLFAIIESDQPNLSAILALLVTHYDPLTYSGQIPILSGFDHEGYSTLGRAMLRYDRSQEPVVAFIMVMLSFFCRKTFHERRKFPNTEMLIDGLTKIYLNQILHKVMTDEGVEIFCCKYALSIAEQNTLDQMALERFLMASFREDHWFFLKTLYMAQIDVSEKVLIDFAFNSFISRKLNQIDVEKIDKSLVFTYVIGVNNVTNKELIEWFIVMEYLRLRKKTFDFHGVESIQHFLYHLKRCTQDKKYEICREMKEFSAFPKMLGGVLESSCVKEMIDHANKYQSPGQQLLDICMASEVDLGDITRFIAELYEKGLFNTSNFLDLLTCSNEMGANGYTELCLRHAALARSGSDSQEFKVIWIVIALLYTSGAQLQFGEKMVSNEAIQLFESRDTMQTMLIQTACEILEENECFHNQKIKSFKHKQVLNSLHENTRHELARILLTNLELWMAKSPISAQVKASYNPKKDKVTPIQLKESNVYELAVWYRLSILLFSREVNMFHGKNLYDIVFAMFNTYSEQQRLLLELGFNAIFLKDATTAERLREHPSIKKICHYTEDRKRADKALVELLMEEDAAANSKKVAKKAALKVKDETKAPKKPKEEKEKKEIQVTKEKKAVAPKVSATVDPKLEQENSTTQVNLPPVVLSNVAVQKPLIEIDEALLQSFLEKIELANSDSAEETKQKVQLFIEFAVLLQNQFSDTDQPMQPIHRFFERLNEAEWGATIDRLSNQYRVGEGVAFCHSALTYWNRAIKAMMKGVKIGAKRSASNKASASVYNTMISCIGVDYSQLGFLDEILAPLFARLDAQGIKHQALLGGGRAQQLLNLALDLPYQSVADSSDYDVSLIIALPEGVSMSAVCGPAMLREALSHTVLQELRDYSANDTFKCHYNLTLSYQGREVDVIFYDDPNLVLRTKRPDSFKSALIGLNDKTVVIPREHLSYTIEGKRFFNDETFGDKSMLAYMIREIGRNAKLRNTLPLCAETQEKLNELRKPIEGDYNALYKEAVALCLTKYVRTPEGDLFYYLLEKHYLDSIFPHAHEMHVNMVSMFYVLQTVIQEKLQDKHNYFVFILMLCYQFQAYKEQKNPYFKLESFPKTLQRHFEQFSDKLVVSPTYQQGPRAWNLSRIFESQKSAVPNLWLPPAVPQLATFIPNTRGKTLS